MITEVALLWINRMSEQTLREYEEERRRAVTNLLGMMVDAITLETQDADEIRAQAEILKEEGKISRMAHAIALKFSDELEV